MAFLVLFGVISYLRLGVSRMPDVDFPVISVRLSLPNAAPALMEAEVVDVVEGSLLTIPGVKNITSSSRRGSANITAEFELNIDIDDALNEVQSRILSVQRRLPAGMDPISISKSNPNLQPIMWLTLESETLSRPELMGYVRDVIRDQFTKLNGVGDLMLGGYYEPNIRIWVRSTDLRRYSLTVQDIINTLQKENIEVPAGIVTSGKSEFNIRTIGMASSYTDLRSLRITTRGGQPNFARVTLGQVAVIEKGTEDVRSISRGQGRQAVGFGIIKQSGMNEVALSDAIRKKIAELNRSLPAGMELKINMDSTDFTRNAVNDMAFSILLAALFTALVSWLFLGSITSTLNILITIPFSVIGTFIAVYALGFTLNTFTLMAISLVIGIIVDDAIMVLENIMRHREEGQPRLEAALRGSNEVVFAATATSIAIVAIFFPVAFMKGVIGRYFFQFGVTLSLSVLLSLLGALTITPAFAARTIEVKERRLLISRFVDGLMRRARGWYGRVLPVVLRHRVTVLSSAFVLFALSLLIVFVLPKEMVPTPDEGRFQIRVMAPPGSSLELTDAKVKAVEDILARRPEVDRFFSMIGGFGGDVSQGRVTVLLKPKGKRGRDPRTHRDWVTLDVMSAYRGLFKDIKGARIIIQDLSFQAIAGTGGSPVEFAVQGPDWDQLIVATKKLSDALEKTGRLTDLNTDYREGAPELKIIPDREKAAARGVSTSTIADAVNIMLGGVVASEFYENGKRFDVRIKLRDSTADPQALIRALYVRNSFGELIPLSSLVRIMTSRDLAVINRLDRQRAITVTAGLAKGFPQNKALELVNKTASKVLPSGYYIRISGSAKVFKESFSGLFVALLLGIAVAYMVLAVQFNSFFDPISVLVALPFSVTGAFLSLWITGNSLNIYSMIGLILLMGIVKKNSIMLVDFTNRIRETEKLSITDALVKACPIRLRPILMTSFAIIAAALPVALAIGPGAETRVPMAVTVIGGVLVSMFLTLFVVPCVYTYLARDKDRKSRTETEPQMPPT
jgi:HAE1 family hydrophobic/amphiphilic exporter-1